MCTIFKVLFKFCDFNLNVKTLHMSMYHPKVSEEFLVYFSHLTKIITSRSSLKKKVVNIDQVMLRFCKQEINWMKIYVKSWVSKLGSKPSTSWSFMITLTMCCKVKLIKYNLLAKVVLRVCQIHLYTDGRSGEIKRSYRFGEDKETEGLFTLETE